MLQRKTLYDMMATAIRIVLENTDDKFIRRFFTISSKKRKELDDSLEYWFPEFIKAGNSLPVSNPNTISESMVERLESFTEMCLKNKDMLLLAEFLNKLDGGLAFCVWNYTADNEEIFGLNDNWEEQGVQLLPKCYCSWEHRNKAKNSSYNLNNLLNHFYFIDTKEFYRKTGFDVSHIFMNDLLWKTAVERKTLRVGLTPLYDKARLSLAYEEKERCVFQVESVSDLTVRKENALAVLERAKEKEVDILCYPEMLGSPEILNALQERSNKAVVLDGTGEVLCVQDKQYPYSFLYNDQEYEEDIEGSQKVCLLHCNGIGRIAVAICKDALIRDYVYQALNNLRVSLLIIPSFSTGFFDFETNLETCKAYDCNVVWINACSAKKMLEKEELGMLGYVLKTGKLSTIKNGFWPYWEKSCPKSKEETCGGCLYIQEMYMECHNF